MAGPQACAPLPPFRWRGSGSGPLADGTPPSPRHRSHVRRAHGLSVAGADVTAGAGDPGSRRPRRRRRKRAPGAAPRKRSVAAARRCGARAARRGRDVQADTAERTITVDNGVVRAVFSNRGATLTAWELLTYLGPDGKPVDLVPHDVPPNQPKPFSLKLDDAAKTRAAEQRAVHARRRAARSNADASAPVTIAFEYQDAAGLHARKQFRIEPNSYVVTVTAIMSPTAGRAVNPVRAVGSGPGRCACDRRRQHVHAAPQVGSDVLDRRRCRAHSGGRLSRRRRGIKGPTSLPASTRTTSCPRR